MRISDWSSDVCSSDLEGRRTNSPRDARTKTSAGISRKRRSNAVKIKPPPPTTQRGRETRRRLMAALTVLLQERAFHEIRLEDITHEAGVRVSLFYHYFQSKDRKSTRLNSSH